MGTFPFQYLVLVFWLHLAIFVILLLCVIMLAEPLGFAEDYLLQRKLCSKTDIRARTPLMRPSQTVFMPDRNILEGVVVLHEMLHEIHTKKLDGVVFKVDFKKAYDKVK